MRLLILGGTGEARALAARLVADHQVTTALAGRVRHPALPVGAYLIGGFGGVAGLVDYLRRTATDQVLDATHPFARTITEHAVAACTAVGVPLVVVRRPGWSAGPGDDWRRVGSITEAASVVGTSSARSVFLTTGRRQTAPFADDAERHYLIRAVDPPTDALPPRHTVLLDRGPYTVDGELALLERYDIGLLVTKDSGGALTAAKLEAARRSGIPVVMVDRPPLPAAEVVQTVEQVVAAVEAQRRRSR